jgi:hypothetical protein
MANSDFEMPKVIGNGAQRAVEEALQPPPATPYAPPRSRDNYPSQPAPSPYATHKTPTHSEAIKERLKQLTHREMRDFVGEIFDAHRKLRTERAPPLQNASVVDEAVYSISLAQFPDVLDKFAYGD